MNLVLAADFYLLLEGRSKQARLFRVGVTMLKTWIQEIAATAPTPTQNMLRIFRPPLKEEVGHRVAFRYTASAHFLNIHRIDKPRQGDDIFMINAPKKDSHLPLVGRWKQAGLFRVGVTMLKTWIQEIAATAPTPTRNMLRIFRPPHKEEMGHRVTLDFGSTTQ